MKSNILSFVVNNDKFLALRSESHHDHGPSEWFVVTGFVEHGETHEDAVQREVLEETNLVAMSILPLNWGSIYGWNGEACEELNFMCFVKPGNVVLNEEHDSFSWLDLDNFVKTIRWDDDKVQLRNVLTKALERKQLFRELKLIDFRSKKLFDGQRR